MKLHQHYSYYTFSSPCFLKPFESIVILLPIEYCFSEKVFHVDGSNTTEYENANHTNESLKLSFPANRRPRPVDTDFIVNWYYVLRSTFDSDRYLARRNLIKRILIKSLAAVTCVAHVSRRVVLVQYYVYLQLVLKRSAPDLRKKLIHQHFYFFVKGVKFFHQPFRLIMKIYRENSAINL